MFNYTDVISRKHKVQADLFKLHGLIVKRASEYGNDPLHTRLKNYKRIL